MQNRFQKNVLPYSRTGIDYMMRRKPQRQQVRLLTTALQMEVRAFASVGGGGRRRQNLQRKREAKVDRWKSGNIPEELGKTQECYAR